MDPEAPNPPKCPTCGRALPEAGTECDFCQKWKKRFGWDGAPAERHHLERKSLRQRLGWGSEPVEPRQPRVMRRPPTWEDSQPVVHEPEIRKLPARWDDAPAPLAPVTPALPRHWRRVRAYVKRPGHLAVPGAPWVRVLAVALLAVLLIGGFVALRHRAAHGLRVAETDTAHNSLPVLSQHLEGATWVGLPTPPGHPDGVTLEMFNSITGGMTVGEVFALLGPGDVVTGAGDSPEEALRVTYGWRGDPACGRMVVVEFEGGHAVARGKSTD